VRLSLVLAFTVLFGLLAACTPAVIASPGTDGGPSKDAGPGTDAGPTVPGAPTDVTAAAGDQSASVAWTAPMNNGGLPIGSYTVLVSPDSPSAVVVVNGTRAAVSPLTNGMAYTFVVYATNAVGNGPTSAPSAPVTPTATTASRVPVGSSVP
jgi:hypothetical protein